MSEAPPIRRTTITRSPITSRYNGMHTTRAAGQVLTVTYDEGKGWGVWTLADPDEILNDLLIAIVTDGIPLPDGQWTYLNSVTTVDRVWLAFTETQRSQP